MAQTNKEDIKKYLGIIIIILSVIIIAGLFYTLQLNSNYKKLQLLHSSMQMGGDTTRRFSVNFTSSPNPAPNQNVTLKFVVVDAATGAPIKDYDLLFTKPMHLVIVDNSLVYYDHIHPTLNGSEFSITTKFPKSDLYHLYLNFQPQGATEQQFAFTLPVGDQVSSPSAEPTALSRNFGNMQVTLSTSDSSAFNAAAISDVAQILNFNFKDATGKPISDLQPYLGAFGHLVMINEQNYKYIHIHPIASDNPNAGGPDVKFLPAAMFEKVTPGIYRVFGQFMRNDQLFVADFTIEVK